MGFAGHLLDGDDHIRDSDWLVCHDACHPLLQGKVPEGGGAGGSSKKQEAAKSRKEGGETDSEEKPFTDKSNDDEMSD